MKNDWTPGCDVKADVPDDHKGRHYDVFEEVVLLTAHLRKHGVFNTINEQVRGCRGGASGAYAVIDFLAVLAGLCGEWRAHRWREFYESQQPFAIPFMALFERDQLPSRSALSRLFFSGIDGGTR